MLPVASDWQAWCDARRRSLAAPDSWLGLVGLFWLNPGENSVGSADDCIVRLPAGPERLGIVALENVTGKAPVLSWRAAAGVQVEISGLSAVAGSTTLLRSDADGKPSLLAVGDLRFFVIERAGRFAVRVKDFGWPARTPFAGLACYPYDPAWVIDAQWQDLPTPVHVEIPSLTGELKSVTLEHRAVFEHAGQSVSLLPLDRGPDTTFFVFRDATSGKETYGGGRFLNAGLPSGGRIRLDFNRAHNPPCAFSPFATCPLPPAENWLRFAITAGEKKYAAGH